ncbi:MAG: Holliday junction branch migration protein RuvA [Armatimonadota bacterium]|nr:Holliday junction branch migration protein RuvA [Armatimonadota bacterium]
MIAHLCGELKRIEADYVVVDVGGVGYKVCTPLSVAAQLPKPGEKVSLLITTVVREDSITLYGFTEEAQQRIFELMIGVSGVGPRLALNILSIMPVEQIVRAISNDGFAELSKVPGIGTKTAQRIVLELREKIAALGWATETKSAQSAEMRVIDDAVEGLVALGYTRSDARAAVQKVLGQQPESSPSSLVTAALKLLSKG